MDLARSRILITGGAGFIGSHLADALVDESPNEIHVVDNLFLGSEENLAQAKCRFRPLFFHKLDATNQKVFPALLTRLRPDVVFNLATKALGHSFEDPQDAFHVNVLITGHLLEALRLGEIGRLIHFSSSEVYGTAQTIPMPETHPMMPHTPYAAGKASADLMIRAYQETFGIRLLTLRPFNNYGPRQNTGLYAGVVPITMKRILKGDPPIIFGTGNQTRDFIFVQDTARIAVELSKLDGLYSETVNIGTGVETSIEDLIRRICRVSGYEGSIEHGPARPGDVSRHCADGKKFAKTGVSLRLHTLDEGLRTTWEWYRSQ
jgi:UDP-glucose 4-epimerase